MSLVILNVQISNTIVPYTTPDHTIETSKFFHMSTILVHFTLFLGTNNIAMRSYELFECCLIRPHNAPPNSVRPANVNVCPLEALPFMFICKKWCTISFKRKHRYFSKYIRYSRRCDGNFLFRIFLFKFNF